LFEKDVAYLEVNLRELENKYPTIPAIEVTIPHVHASLNLLQLKYAIVQIKTYRYNSAFEFFTNVANIQEFRLYVN